MPNHTGTLKATHSTLRVPTYLRDLPTCFTDCTLLNALVHSAGMAYLHSACGGGGRAGVAAVGRLAAGVQAHDRGGGCRQVTVSDCEWKVG
jgi:hypothetical protein